MTPENIAVKGGTIGREIWPESRELTIRLGFFYMPQICDMGQDRIFTSPSEGRRAEDLFFFALKNPTASAWFEPRELWVPKASTLPLDHRTRFTLNLNIGTR
jgi:hypothetical protein